jgi:hypothetical protein
MKSINPRSAFRLPLSQVAIMDVLGIWFVAIVAIAYIGRMPLLLFGDYGLQVFWGLLEERFIISFADFLRSQKDVSLIAYILTYLPNKKQVFSIRVLLEYLH